MNDAVDRLIVERGNMDRGLTSGVIASVSGHLLVVAAVLAASFLGAHEPPIKVMEGFAVVMPRGGGGTPAVEPPAPAPPVTAPPEPAPPPKAEPPPALKVIKPPKEPPKKGLPEPDAKPTRKKPQKAEAPRLTPAAGVPGGTGTTPKTPGIELGPPGPGVATGTDDGGDWYLASVQQKIWTIWTQQIQTGMTQAVTVSFTIEADGSVSHVQIVQSCGASLVDLAAQRAIYSAAPFGPLPRTYDEKRKPLQVIFKPTQ